MLLESLFKDVEKLIENQEQNMTNKVNIEFLKQQVDKLQTDEKLIRNGRITTIETVVALL